MTLMIFTAAVFVVLLATILGIRYRTRRDAKAIRHFDERTIERILTAAARFDASRELAYEHLPCWATVEMWVNARKALRIAEELYRWSVSAGNTEKQKEFLCILENVAELYSTLWHLLLQCCLDRLGAFLTGCGKNPYVGAAASSYRRLMVQVAGMAVDANSDYAQLFREHI